MEKGQQNRLKRWQDRMQRNLTAYQPILDEMDNMNTLYNGEPCHPSKGGDGGKWSSRGGVHGTKHRG